MSSFPELVDDAFGPLWGLRPHLAVYLGRHEYDGIVPDWSPGSVEEHLEELRRVRAALSDLEELDREEELDRRQLMAGIDEALLDWESLRWWRRNPMTYLSPLEVDLYLNRSFAPKPERMAIVRRVLDRLPEFLEQARVNLAREIPQTYREWAVRNAQGMAGFVEDDLQPHVDELADERLAEPLNEARAGATVALQDFAAWLESEIRPSPPDDFRVGEGVLGEMLRRSELVDLSVEDLLAIGEEDLAANLEAFGETAARIDDSLSPREVYDRHVASVHPSADELIPFTARMLEEIRTFLIEEDIIGIPGETRCEVRETPPYLRWAFAWMDTPGPYEEEATEAFYYVTPVEPTWSEEEAEEWLRALNSYALAAFSIHEAYPGHYVHFLHAQSAPTEVSKRLASYAFSEGWAHYTEQMMWEEGYGEGDLRFRLAQLTEALVRNCRFVCAIRMHAGEMTVDEATRFFVQNAFYEESPARKEAERGTFDPGYYSYTLGKLEILRLRQEVKQSQAGSFSLREFHDTLISRGAPPVGLMGELFR